MNELEGFSKIVDEIVELKRKKSLDYGNSWRIMGIDGIDFMIAKKFLRIWNLRGNPVVNNESREDTYRDMAIYAIMAIQLMREKQTHSLMDELVNQSIIEQRNINS